MATCYIQKMPNQKSNLLLGEDTAVKETVEVGTFIYIGTDTDGNLNRVIPVSDSSAHCPDGIALTTTANTSYTKDVCAVALWPVRMLTTNVDGSNPPEAVADNRVYVLDAGTASDADGGTAGWSIGVCNGVESVEGTTMYDLNLTGRDET